MLINSIKMEFFNAKVLSINFGTSEVDTYEDWIRGSNTPKIADQSSKYSECEIKFLVEGSTPSICEEKISDLAAQLSNCTINFEGDYIFNFKGFLSSVSREKINKIASIITVVLKGRKTKYITKTFSKSITDSNCIYIPLGNTEVDATLTVTPPANITSIDIGLWTDLDGSLAEQRFRLNNLTSGIKYYISGRLGKVYYYNSNGAFVNNISNYDSYEFPVLKGGETTRLDIASISGYSGSKIFNFDVIYDARWQ